MEDGREHGSLVCRPALDEAMTNEDAWCSAHVLRCGRDTYDVVLNPPSMERVGFEHVSNHCRLLSQFDPNNQS